MARIDNLAKAVQELQKVGDFEPPMKTKGKSEKELEALLKEAAAELSPEDTLSKETQAIFKELKITVGEAPEAEEEEEEEEEEEAAGEEEEEEEAKDEKPAKKEKAAAPAKKAKSESDVRLSSDQKIEFFSPLIQSGKYTAAELVAKVNEKHPGVSESSIKTFLSDSKNEKYNKFPKLVVAAEDGKLSFKK